MRTLITYYSEIEASINFHMKRSHGSFPSPQLQKKALPGDSAPLLERVAGGLPGKAEQPYIT